MRRADPRHQPVACDLGDDRGGSDGKAEAVARHHGADRAGQDRRNVAVDEGVCRRRRQRRHGAAHGEQGGLEDVQPVDLGDVGDADADLHVVPDRIVERLARRPRQLLGVVDAGRERGRHPAILNDRRCRDDRSRPWPAASFVYSGDAAA